MRSHRPWTRVALALLLCVAVFVLGCRRATPPPALDLRPVPWADGERSVYDIYGSSGALVDSAAYSFRAEGEGWALTRETIGKKGRAELHLDRTGMPLSSHTVRDSGDTADVGFPPRSAPISAITVKRTVKGKSEQRELPGGPSAIDGREFYEFLRILPLGKGYAHDVSMVDGPAFDATDMTMKVVGEETVTVPAGTYACWRVEVDTHVSGTRDMWIGKEPPYPWVKYRWPGRSQIVLRSEQRTAGAAVTGASAAAPQAPGSGGPPPAMNWLLAILQLALQFPVTVFAPMLLVNHFARRWKVPHRVWMMGMIAFPASQVVHLPLNWLLGLGGSPGPLTGAPLWAIGIAAGLSAGVCEEMSRYLFMRFALRASDQRGWSRGVLFGIGHGGIESMIFGGLPALGALNLVIASLLPFLIPAAQRGALAPAIEGYAAVPWWASVYATAERLLAMSAHVLMSVLVMRAVTRKNPAYLLAAIAFHTALDAPLVYKAALGSHGLMGYIALMGVLALGLTLALRPSGPDEDAPGHEA